VRLVGLSGVGKTRLCEALFDDKIGRNGLDPSLAFYTNIAEGPSPPPVGLASDLIAARQRGVLVIDNCPSELHGELMKVAREANSTISVITVEYDIRDDQPEGTDVFALDTSSPALIEKLVARRYHQISQIDAGTIAQFSGGNARVALALAATVEKNESIAGLSNVDLFQAALSAAA
jgi:GTPase SAR1 family protein